jgi:hypothetical protein
MTERLEPVEELPVTARREPLVDEELRAGEMAAL